MYCTHSLAVSSMFFSCVVLVVVGVFSSIFFLRFNVGLLLHFYFSFPTRKTLSLLLIFVCEHTALHSKTSCRPRCFSLHARRTLVQCMLKRSGMRECIIVFVIKIRHGVSEEPRTDTHAVTRLETGAVQKYQLEPRSLQNINKIFFEQSMKADS